MPGALRSAVVKGILIVSVFYYLVSDYSLVLQAHSSAFMSCFLFGSNFVCVVYFMYFQTAEVRFIVYAVAICSFAVLVDSHICRFMASKGNITAIEAHRKNVFMR